MMQKNLQEEIKKNQNKVKIFLPISLILFCVILVSIIIIAINVNEDNALLLEIISIVIALILGFISIYLIIEKVHLPRVKNKFLNIINNSQKISYNGVVISNDKKITLSKYKTCNLIIVDTSNNEKVELYVDEDVIVNLNNSYEFITVNNYVLDMKEVKK